tara:strand:- start:324 stop:560 length:237 start_codon:yes stop_codon:yes gene_type:complete
MGFNEWLGNKVTGFFYGFLSTVVGSAGCIIAFIGFMLSEDEIWWGKILCGISPILLLFSGYLYLRGKYHSDITPILQR